MIRKVKVLLSIASLLLFVTPSAAADFTYQEYSHSPEAWKRGFVFGIARYMSIVAQPDEEPPYPVRTAFQRCRPTGRGICRGQSSQLYGASGCGHHEGIL
jgi:hypothetical protein